MRRHSRQSRGLSVISCASSASYGTATSASTTWGPGTLSGKALEAFGEATLRGVENLVIRRKLASLRSHFPHDNNTTDGKIEEVYDNVLELTRTGLYSKRIIHAALRLIEVQIGCSETNHLIRALCKFPEIEIRLFLPQIMSKCMDDVEKWHEDVTDIEIRRNQPPDLPRQAAQLVSTIIFIAKLIESNDFARRAALEGGFFDMLLRTYVVFPTFYKSIAEKRSYHPPLLDACKSVLAVLSTEFDYLEIMLVHPVHDLWLISDKLIPDYFGGTPEEVLEGRCLAWRRTDALIVKRRLITIWSIFPSLEHHSSRTGLQVCADIVEFSRPEYYDSDVVTLALLTIFKYIFVGAKSTQYLAFILAKGTCQDMTYIISNILQLWLEYAGQRGQRVSVLEPVGFLDNGSQVGGGTAVVSGPSGPDPTFYDLAKSILFAKIESKQKGRLPRDDTSLNNVVHFLITTADQNVTVRRGLIDAGAIAFALIPFVDNVPMLCELLDAFREPSNTPKHNDVSDVSQDTKLPCIPLSLINSEARKLLGTIQIPAFQALLQTPIFTERRLLCFSLLESLLGQDEGEDDMYTETRLLFDQILG